MPSYVPVTRRTLVSVVIALLVTGSAIVSPKTVADRGLADRGSDPDLPVMSVKKAKNGIVLRPGATGKLKVKLTDRQNRPVQGERVVFVAPGQGPSGSFKGSDRDTPHLLHVTTNAKGLAKAKFTAGDVPGVFLVSALLEDEPAVSMSFGITVSASAPQPVFAADKARQAVASEILFDQLEDETFKLHGPVLLETGTTVRTAGPGSSFYFPTEPVTVERLSWLFWVDLNPTAEFAHPTRFIVVDATRAPGDLSAEARVTNEGWWPEVLAPDAESPDDLVPPFLQTDAFGFNAGAAIPAGPKRGAPEDACAIVLYGLNIAGWVNTGNMARHLVDRGLVSPGNIYAPGNPFALPGSLNPPATRDDFERLVQQAANNGCQKVYVYITAHGYDRGEFDNANGSTSAYGGGFALASTAGGRLQKDFVSYEDTLEILEPLRDRELCFILQACYSGQLCEWFQGAGFTGTFVSSADRDSSSLSAYTTRDGAETPLGSYFTNALIECWADDIADTDGQNGVTLDEAFTWASSLGIRQVDSPKPKLAPIDPEASANHPLPDLFIRQSGGSALLEIRRPPGVPLNVRYDAKLTIDDTSVAVFTGVPGGGSMTEVTIPANIETGLVSVTGVDDFTTTVTLMGRETFTGQSFAGMGRILVGGSYGVRPDPLTIDVEVGTATAKLRQFGPITQIPGTFRICFISRDESIAKPVSADLTLPEGATELDFDVMGVSVGSTFIDVLDKRTGNTTFFEVRVRPPQVACDLFQTARFDSTFRVKSDDDDHDLVLQIRRALVQLERSSVQRGGQEVATISGSHPSTITASGTIDSSTCTVATAGGMGLVIGIPNVRCEYRNVVVSVGTNRAGKQVLTITGDYALGLGGEFPGGNPIVYEFEGTLVGE